MLKPHYFVENRTRQPQPAPEPGAGDEHADHHRPRQGRRRPGRAAPPARPIIDLIEQHHGTTLVEYFYHEANRQADRQPERPGVEESAFRYPGPKPQTKEAGHPDGGRRRRERQPDALRADARADRGAGPRLCDKRLRDGQFDECGLTLRKSTRSRSLIKSLIGIYHARIKYPEQRTA